VLSAEVKVPHSGVSSYNDLVEFVQTTINEKTDVHDDTTGLVLAEAIVQSILNRLRIGF
jgi:hypothetical protein